MPEGQGQIERGGPTQDHKHVSGHKQQDSQLSVEHLVVVAVAIAAGSRS